MSSDIDLQHQFYDMLLRSQYWSPERMLDYQRSQLGQLLWHAKKNTSFYEHRLDAVLRPDGEIDWDRWGDIPIVKRSDLLEHREALKAKYLPDGHGPIRAIHSSGSTGQPIEVFVTNINRLSSEVARWRAMTWLDLDFSRNLCIRHGESPDIRPPNGASVGVWGPPWLEESTRGRSFVMTRSWPVPDQLDFMIHTRASYAAIGGPKTAHVLAVEARRRGISHSLSHFLVNGERCNDDDRQIVRDVFGAEIVELYSSKEGGQMAHPCPTGHGYHINAERVLVELLDDTGRPVAAGQPGKVVITPFFSTAQPLIRYQQGDIARWGTHCGCGRSLPLLQSLDGRVSHMFRHPDGRRVSRWFPERYREILGARMWQFAQVGPTEFELRYVAADPARVGDEATITKAFREWYFEDATLTFRRLDDIPFAKSGKYHEYLYEVPEVPGAASP